MTIVVNVALTVVALLYLVPAIVLAVQCWVAALAPTPKRAGSSGPQPRIGILVPAHNESAVVAATIASISAQLAEGDRLLVIADNCTDNTAEISRTAGAEVHERQNLEQRGKGFALAEGLKILSDVPPEVVMIIDADCILGPGTLDALSRTAAEYQRPVQGAYLMPPPPNPRPADVVSSLAVLVKNFVRPLGMAKLQLPCLLTGSGAAFPWGMLTPESFVGAHIVEDMQLAVDLTLAGKPPRFCPEAVITAPLPDKEAAFVSQRTRWEHGHLQTLLTQCPRLFWGFLKSADFRCLVMMLDLCVPPLSLFVMLGVLLVAVTSVAGFWTGNPFAALLAFSAVSMVFWGIIVAWFRFGRSEFPLSVLFSIPRYMLGKIPLYAGFLYRRQTDWVRTNRNSQS